MQRMLTKTSPTYVMTKQKLSKSKHIGKYDKKSSFEKKFKVEKTSPSNDHLNPVVILNRLPDDYKKLNISRTQPFNHKSKIGPKNRTKKRTNYSIQKNQCEEVNEEDCSLVETENKTNIDEPEVDVIDGVKFLSFLHEPDIPEFSCFHSSYHPFFSDCSSENSFEDSFNEDYKQKIIPTKTRDITQIKGWRKKLFGNCYEYGMPSDDNSGLNANEDDIYSFKDLDSDHDPAEDFYPSMGTCDEGEIIFDAAEEEKDVKSSLDDDTLRSHLELSKVELKASNSESAFQSKGLEDFLGNSSELRIGLLSQYNPNVKVIEKDSPILAVGTLKKDDYVPPWKKMMERQRKRQELLAARTECLARKNAVIENAPKPTLPDPVQTESANKIVWLDEGSSESDETYVPNDNKAVTVVEDNFKYEVQNTVEAMETDESKSPSDLIESEAPETEMTMFEPHEIKEEPNFEESIDNDDSDFLKKFSSSEYSSGSTAGRTKREKKLSWKLLSSFEQKLEKKRNKHIKSSPVNSSLEEPIRISLKHSPDRSSWVINNVIPEGEYIPPKGKRKRKIRNYSFIYDNDNGVFKDNLPEFEIVNKTVWSKNRVLEKELVHFLSDLRSSTAYDDALIRFQGKNGLEDDTFPVISEKKAMKCCVAVHSSHSKAHLKKIYPSPVVAQRPKVVPSKKLSRLTELQNSLKYMDLDPLILTGDDDSNKETGSTKKKTVRKVKPSIKYREAISSLRNDMDDPDDFEVQYQESVQEPPPTKRKRTINIVAPLTSNKSPKTSTDAINLDDSGEEIPPLVNKNTNTERNDSNSSSSSDDSTSQSPSENALASSSADVIQVPAGNSDEIIELPAPESEKSDEEAAPVAIKKRPKDNAKKRKKHNRQLQKTLILKYFRHVNSGDTVLKSFIIANTNITSKAKDNMNLSLCAVGLTLKKGPEAKNDICLLYGRLNDPVYNDSVRKSFYEEQHGIETHHYVVPIILQISKAAMRSSNDLKLIRIPLKGRALMDNMTESVPLMIYPVAPKPSDEDLAEYSSKTENSPPEVPSAIPKEPKSTNVSTLKDGKTSPENITLSSGNEESPKKNQDSGDIVRFRKTKERNMDVDVLSQSDEEAQVDNVPKKVRFIPLNRTEGIRRMNETVMPTTPRLLPLLLPKEPVPSAPIKTVPSAPKKPVPSTTKKPVPLAPKPLVPVASINPMPVSPKPKTSPVPIAPKPKVCMKVVKKPPAPTNPPKSDSTSSLKLLPPSKQAITTPVFSGTFGASKALATLKCIADKQAQLKESKKNTKDVASNLSPQDDVTLVKEILSDNKNGSPNKKAKQLKLLSSQQLRLISGIVDSSPTLESTDPYREQELISATEAAWHLVGPCIVKRVRLKTGNLVYVYESADSGERSQAFPLRHSSPIITLSHKRVITTQKTDPELVKSQNQVKNAIKTYTSNRLLSPVTSPQGRNANLSPVHTPVTSPQGTVARNTTLSPAHKPVTQGTVARNANFSPVHTPITSQQGPVANLSPKVSPAVAVSTLVKPSPRINNETPNVKLEFGSPEGAKIPNMSLPPAESTPELIALLSKKTDVLSNDIPTTSAQDDLIGYEDMKSDSKYAKTLESDEAKTSVWIGSDGEPCYVMRLDENQDEKPTQKDGVGLPTIFNCFPISEEEFQRCDNATETGII